jgi:hypothetical protein
MQRIIKLSSKHSLFLLIVLVLTIVSLNVPTIHAAGMTITWTGSAHDGKWETAANWIFGDVPGANDLVIISGPVTVSLSNPANIASLVLQAPAVLNCNLGCSLTSGISNYGTVNNHGLITDLLGNTIENFGGTINNSGSIIVNNISTNSGTITNNNGGSVAFGGGVTNSGTITNTCGSTVSGTVSGRPVNAIKC